MSLAIIAPISVVFPIMGRNDDNDDNDDDDTEDDKIHNDDDIVHENDEWSWLPFV